MRIEDKLSSTQPALVITYGNTTRKIRPLDRPVMMLGQAPGCDLQLKSPDVCPVHLLIVRVPGGWLLRDCSGRGSARLNGMPIGEELLRNGDVIQLSTFSFQLHLPNPCLAAEFAASLDTVLDREPPSAPLGDAALLSRADSADKNEINRLRHSRQHLAQLALRLRQRSQMTQNAFLQLQQQVEEREAMQEAQQREVDSLLTDLKARVRLLEQKEADVRSRRTALDQEQTEWRANQALVEGLKTEESLRQDRIRAGELEHYVCYLRRQIGRQAAEIQRLQVEHEQARRDCEDQSSYEADLNICRRELERDRADLNGQLALLQMKAQEIERSRHQLENGRIHQVATSGTDEANRELTPRPCLIGDLGLR
jgi:Inner membrane component of T3SS, cytoplasmic domain